MMDLSKPLLQSWRARDRRDLLIDEEKGDKREGPVEKLQKSYFDVPGICCSLEISLVENILKPINGVEDVSVIVVSKTVIVIHDDLLVSQAQIVDLLNKARLEARIKGSGEAVGIFPIILKGIAAIRGSRIDINILVLSAVIGTVALKEYGEAGTIVFLFTIAQWLVSRASHKATSAMFCLMGMAPQKATIAETGEVVDVHEVQLGSVLAVKAGEVVPMDGIVVDGISEVDEKTLTGESFPVCKQVDSSVWAGTINLNGYISVRTTALAEDCVVAQMAKLVEEAQSKKSGTQRFIDDFAKFYTPVVLFISVGFAVVPMALWVPDRDHWLRLALVVLVSACPCALILSTPVATFCALTKAAEHGLLVKGGGYLEILGKMNTVTLDKTGTITRGEFSVSEFQSFLAEISLETLLYWVSSIECKSSHPIAAPLIQYARSFGVEPRPNEVEDFQNFPGEGIYGKIDGRDIFIGNKRIAIKARSENVPLLPAGANGGKTVVCVFLGETLVGMFSLSDECRDGAAEVIGQLKSLNIKTAMLTGDTLEAAIYADNHIRNSLDLVYAELLPEEKLIIIEELKKEGLTAMVGDGINDAPSLAASDIGISMGISGSALAIETGHIILMSNDIGKIPRAVTLARRGQRKVIENVVISVLVKGAILALAFVGYRLVWAAVLADTGTCLLVILNSMLLLRDNHGDGDGDGPGQGQERCRRSPLPIAQNPTAEKVSLDQSQKPSTSLAIGDSNLTPQAQVLGSYTLRACCKSKECSVEQKGFQEKITSASSCCTSERREMEVVSCKSRNCCSEKRCIEKQDSYEYVVSSGEPICISGSSMNEVTHGRNNQNIHVTGDATCISSGSESTKPVIPGCCYQGRCSKTKDSLDASAYDMEQCEAVMIDPNINSSGMALRFCSGNKSAKSAEAGCCSRGRCSTSYDSAVTATWHLGEGKLVAAESVVRLAEPIQNGKEIESCTTGES
ncbi:hypothetical protein SAY86_030942 [Trapa natans]|uniref:HMA domain-containing protein n=1 Tax=Trapa natans TaxID=22666 RepID=A0AAN7RHK3_TRANT|nr:hypothetical protein SAY86_030942 [Trapa natans]